MSEMSPRDIWQFHLLWQGAPSADVSPQWQPQADQVIACNGTGNRAAALITAFIGVPGGDVILGDIFQGIPPIEGGLPTIAMAELEERPVEWIWRGWIPRGALTLLSSDPGRGKSTLTCTIAAIITTGGIWPDGSRSPIGNVLMMAAEDDANTTIRPRLRAAGADLSRVRVVTKFATFPENVAELEQTIRQYGVIAAVVDPISSFIGGKVDSHRDASTRLALDPLTDVGRRTDCALLGVMHLTKGATDRALNKINGSIAFTAAARSVMGVGIAPGDDQLYLLGRIKGNLSKPPAVLSYRLDSFDTGMIDTFGERVTVPNIRWAGERDVRLEELFTADMQRRGSKQTEAIDDWLRAELEDGQRDSEELIELGRGQGFSKKQVWSASQRIGVRRGKTGFQGKWVWELIK